MITLETLNPIITYFIFCWNFEFNLNILETGLINNIIVIIILIYIGNDFLLTLLDERKKTILQNIEEAENRLQEATNRLKESEKQLSQFDIVIRKIKLENIETKKIILEKNFFIAKQDLKLSFQRGINVFKMKERQTFLEIKHQITGLILNLTVKRIKEKFMQNIPATKLIDNTIKNLELPM